MNNKYLGLAKPDYMSDEAWESDIPYLVHWVQSSIHEKTKAGPPPEVWSELGNVKNASKIIDADRKWFLNLLVALYNEPGLSDWLHQHNEELEDALFQAAQEKDMSEHSQDRIEFEGWAEHAYGPKALKPSGNTFETYSSPQIEWQWIAWQASRRAKSVYERPSAKKVRELVDAVKAYPACRQDFQSTNRGSLAWDKACNRLEEAAICLDEALAQFKEK